jgi:heme/copper-type cytochrome/quinol oxidase subunit 2
MSFRFTDALFWAAVVCCAIAQIAIIRSIVSSPTRIRDSGETTSAGRRASEIVWVVLPAIALIFLFLFTWRAMHAPRLPVAIASVSR